MDTSANLLIEELNAILDDHKSHLIVMVDDNGICITEPSQYSALLKEIEIEHDRMLTEVNALFNSSYK